MHDFKTNQTFARFSPCDTGWRKPRESFIHIKNRADRSRSNGSNIVFPLGIIRYFFSCNILVFKEHSYRKNQRSLALRNLSLESQKKGQTQLLPDITEPKMARFSIKKAKIPLVPIQKTGSQTVTYFHLDSSFWSLVAGCFYAIF